MPSPSEELPLVSAQFKNRRECGVFAAYVSLRILLEQIWSGPGVTAQRGLTVGVVVVCGTVLAVAIVDVIRHWNSPDEEPGWKAGRSLGVVMILLGGIWVIEGCALSFDSVTSRWLANAVYGLLVAGIGMYLVRRASRPDRDHVRHSRRRPL